MNENPELKYQLRMLACMIVAALIAVSLPFTEWIIFLVWFVLTLVIFFAVITVQVAYEVFVRDRK